MKKIKVLQIMSGISCEGIGTFVLNVFENIDREKVEMSFALATKYKQHYEERIIEQGANIYRTHEIGDGITGKVKHFINLIKLLKTEGPFDVVHSQMDFFNGINMLAAFIAGVPMRISHAHIATDNKFIPFKKKIYNNIMKLLIKIFATDGLGCSNQANSYINFKSKNTIVVNNGIDLSRFSENSKSILEDFSIEKNKKKFITIGRMEEAKNPIFIVEIINELKKIRDDIHLYWLGRGSMECDIKKLIKKYKLEDTITLLGVRDDIEKVLPQMDFMLFPSKWEGLGIALIEAQASGIPCFISDRIPREADCGLCTIISLDDNQKIWAYKINEYINSKTYNNKINKDYIEKFNINSTVRVLEEIYQGEYCEN